MKYVNLGRSGLKVSRLCLGCMSYGEPERLPQPWSLDEKASTNQAKRPLLMTLQLYQLMLLLVSQMLGVT